MDTYKRPEDRLVLAREHQEAVRDLMVRRREIEIYRWLEAGPCLEEELVHYYLPTYLQGICADREQVLVLALEALKRKGFIREVQMPVPYDLARPRTVDGYELINPPAFSEIQRAILLLLRESDRAVSELVKKLKKQKINASRDEVTAELDTLEQMGFVETSKSKYRFCD